jgi:trigger factor
VAVKQEITRLDNSAVKLTFTYENEDLRDKYNKVVSDFAKDLQIKGFRKGKAPISVLENKLGKALHEDALNAIIGNTVQDALKKEDFPADAAPLPYSEPEVEGEPKLDLSSNLVFSVKYDVMPELKLNKWEGLEVESETAEVTDADINRELEAIRERNAVIMDKEDGAVAEKGDVATVGYSELSESGEEIPNTRREDFTFAIGTGHNIFKFDDEITGMKKGETREIQKSYAEDFEDKELAGKTKKIRVTLSALKQKELPGDDELAQDVSEKFKTIDDLRQSIKEQLTGELENGLEELKTRKLIDKLIELNPVGIPESMINLESLSLLRRTIGNYQVPDETLLEIARKAGSDNAYKARAARNVHSMLIIDKLINDLKVDALDKDLEEMYIVISDETGFPVEKIKQEYAQDNNRREYLVDEIKRKKTLSILKEKNTIKTGKKVNFVDIFSENH